MAPREASQVTSRDPDSTLVLSKTISLTFKGQHLPTSVFLFRIRYAVTPFVSKTSLCYSCFRFGHLKVQCKSHPRCLHCGKETHGKNTPCPKEKESPYCINCKGSHRAISLQCPTYLFHKKIRELAAHKNITFFEARKLIRGDPTPLYNNDDFPIFLEQPRVYINITLSSLFFFVYIYIYIYTILRYYFVVIYLFKCFIYL